MNLINQAAPSLVSWMSQADSTWYIFVFVESFLLRTLVLVVNECVHNLTMQELLEQYCDVVIAIGGTLFLMLYTALVYYQLAARARPWGTPSEVVAARHRSLAEWTLENPSIENLIAANLAGLC